MNKPKLFLSLGPNGEEAFGVFLEIMESLSRRADFAIADFSQMLVRRGGDPHPASARLDATVARIERGEPRLCRALPDLAWVDSFQKPAGDDRPPGFQRAALARKCWQEWIQRTVHDQSVPWFREVHDALESLEASATRLGIARTGLVHAVVVANLTDPREAAVAYALGRFLRDWHTAEIQPVLVAVLGPRQDVSQVADFARGCAVAALEDICGNWKDLGYTGAVLLDGPHSAGGRAVVQLNDRELATVLGEILYVIAASERGRRSLLGYNDRDRPSRPADEPSLMTVSSAAYWFSSSQFARYAALRLIHSANEPPDETDAGLRDKLALDAWPSLGDRDEARSPDDPITRVLGLGKHLEGLVTKDVAGIEANLRRIVERAGYAEMLRGDVCKDRPLVDWPDIVKDLIAIVEQGVVGPVEPVLGAAVEAHVANLGDRITEQVAEAFQDVELEGRLMPGTVVLGGLRLLDRRLPEIHRAASERLREAEQEEIAGAQQHEREIARHYNRLCAEARLPPHGAALAVRAVLVALLVASVGMIGRVDLLGVIVPQVIESFLWGALAGGALWAFLYWWFVPLRRWSCDRIVRQIVRSLDFRCKVLLNRMRVSALESYLRMVRSQLHAMVRPEEPRSPTEASSPEQARAVDGSRAEPLAALRASLVGYAQGFGRQLASLRAEIRRMENELQSSAYLQCLPRLPREGDEVSQRVFRERLDSAVATLLGRNVEREIGRAEQVAAIRHCLSREEGLWRGLIADAGIASVPERLPDWFSGLVERVAGHFFATYCEHVSVNDLLREMSAEEVRWLHAAQSPEVKTKLESPDDAQRDNAKRSVLVEELFAKMQLPLALRGMPACHYYWLSGARSQREDYLLGDFGLNRQTEKGAQEFTDDRATAILLAYARDVRVGDLLESSNSLYRDLLERVRQQYPNQPELAPVSEVR